LHGIKTAWEEFVFGWVCFAEVWPVVFYAYWSLGVWLDLMFRCDTRLILVNCYCLPGQGGMFNV